ncbi:MAG: tetratricopeptide repeat protein [Gemmatimonadales bacterium]
MPGAVAKKKRKDDLSQEDRFLHFIEEGSAWVQAHTRAVLMITVGLVLLVGGVLYYRSYRESLRTRAAIELNQLRATLTMADAVPRLTGFVARFAGTPAATDGRLLLAKIQLQSGQPQAALEVLDPIASEPVDVPSGYAVKLLLAEAYKNSGEYERSLAQLDAIIDGAYVPMPVKPEDFEQALTAGRLEEAEVAYQRLVDDESATDDLYRVRLGEIQAMIASGAAPEPTAFSAPAPTPPEQGVGALVPDSEAAEPGESAPDAELPDTASSLDPSDGSPASGPAMDSSTADDALSPDSVVPNDPAAGGSS